MITLQVPTIEGISTEKVYNVYDFPYGTFNKIKTVRKKDTTYYNCACAFDIEATTITEEQNKEIHHIKEFEKPFGFMYHWQFCLIDTVVFGRTWEEFILFCDNLRNHLQLSSTNKLVVYIHNLAYEFQFMKDFMHISSLFCKDTRKPMKMECDGIEFRCSYFLSNMSLIKFCENSENVTFYKLSDEYNYRIFRTPESELTEMEKAYCYNDVRGLCQCIESLLKHDNIVSIPLTNTGFVRREYREAMRKNIKNRYKFTDTALTAEHYKLLKDAFRGGNTHANRFMSGLILDNVWSFDIASSYPACIMLDDFPIGKFMDVTLDNQMKLEYYCNNYCVVMEIEFFNIDLNNDEVIPYIDIAHCKERSKILNDNGRVLHADYIKMTCTNLDLDIIRKTYNYDGFIVTKAIYATRGKLPPELRIKMLDFYKAKTELKGIKLKEYEYMKSKNRINSTFGMMVTAIDHSEIVYDNDLMIWDEDAPDIDAALTEFYRNRNNFLSYQWGVFVTANARTRLQNMLYKVGEDVVYLDTDSIKFVNEKHVAEFEAYNLELLKIAQANDIQAYAEKDGKRYYLGVWDNDGTYKRFKTLGAKKYCYESYNKKQEVEFHVTVSGMHKEKGAARVGGIDNFLIGRTFHDVGRTVSYYHDVKPFKITLDGCTFTTASNIGIIDTTYTLGVTNEYWELIQNNADIDIQDY